jgi:indole-3-pyruvate monooxygenase
MHQEDIVVVGAGPAGLATSACLRHLGLPHMLLEREAEVAPAWRRHYDRLHLHTDKRYSALPFAPWPASAPRYPAREQVVDYLARYAARHAVAPRLGVQVHRIRSHAGRLRLDTSAGALQPRAVVVASGYNAVPHHPVLPGMDEFGGTVLHSRDYRNPRPFSGLRTLVVGCGNSGAEIALDLAEQGVAVAMVVRGPVHVVPRDLFGRPTQRTNVLLAPLPLAWRDAIAGTVLRLAVGDLSRWGLVRPAMGPNRMIETLGRIPLLDIGTVAQIKAGRIRVLPAVEQVMRGAVRFAGGQQHPFDAIILATGYTTGLSGLVEGFEAISDSRGRPHRFGEETGIPGLYFVGFRNPTTGALREMAREAPRVAAAIRAKG